MARKRPVVREVSYGLYERFEADGKGLPGVQAFTTAVPPEVGREFGFILNIKGGRGLKLAWEIDHPRIPSRGPDTAPGISPGISPGTAPDTAPGGAPGGDPDGQRGAVMPPFRGEAFVRSSDFDFFLGDALWEPLAWMVGEWTLSVSMEGQVVNRRTFEVLPPAPPPGVGGPGTDWDALPVQ
jgi:hypothetical protein